MKRGVWLASLSTIGALLSGGVAYTSRLLPGDEPVWLVNWALGNKSALALTLFAVTSVLAAIDWIRTYLQGRHQSRLILDKVINDLSKALFSSGARNNRITLFKCTSGWRIVFWGLVRLPLFSKGAKWLALWRIKLRDSYLTIYLRPADSRGVKSIAAFRVSDNSRECEGVAGLVWDLAGQKMLTDLPKLDREQVARLKTREELEANQLVKEYAAATNVSDLILLKSCDNFARHFYGTLIRMSDASPWGVLLLDSLEDNCPFVTDGVPSESFMQRFNDYAKVIGKIIS